jgi:mono/diheme cytochrome c family protein
MIAVRFRLRWAVPLAVCIGASACASGGSAGAPAATTAAATTAASDGYYTAAQGERGGNVFSESCAGCHTDREFSGRIFEMSWSGKSLFEFYDFIRSAMPDDDPGVLSDQEYADIVAYVLQSNDYATGSGELPTRPDVLSSLRFK